jgi:hypothetical protein
MIAELEIDPSTSLPAPCFHTSPRLLPTDADVAALSYRLPRHNAATGSMPSRVDAVPMPQISIISGSMMPQLCLRYPFSIRHPTIAIASSVGPSAPAVAA